MRLSPCYLIINLILAIFVAPVHADISVEASLNPLRFSVQEAAQLTVTVSGSSRSAEIDLPDVNNVRFHRRGQSSQINMINGSVTSSIATTYLVQALAPGNYTLPPITVSAEGNKYTTQAIDFMVEDGSSSQDNGRKGALSQDDIAFLRLSQLGNHYPGEIVPVQLKAYINQKFRVDLNSLPTLQGDGVIMPQLSQKPRQTAESVDGVTYHVLTWDTSLSGIKAGTHQLQFLLDATLLVPAKRRSLSPFGGSSLFDDAFINDSFFESVFGNHQRKPIAITSPLLEFNVIPLPDEGKPDDFTGAIGDFQLSVTAHPGSVEPGEPVTLTMKISGSGNFDRVEAPLFPSHPAWKTYTPTSNLEVGERSYSGTKTFEQAIVTRSNDSSVEVPSLSFSYFDPQKASYVTRTSSPMTIELQASTVPIAPPLPEAEPEPPVQQGPDIQAEKTGLAGLAPLHLDPGSFAAAITPLFFRAWYITLCCLFLLTLAVLLFFHLRRQRLASNPEILQQKRRVKILTGNLSDIEEARLDGDSSRFLRLCRSAIQTQLGLHWQKEASTISLNDLKTQLPADSPLLEIFSTAEEAAFGGASLTAEKMAEFSHHLSRELQSMP